MQFKRTGQTTPTGQSFSSYDTETCYRSHAEALQEVERECNVRFRCFDKWVTDGRLGEVEARDRLERLISAWHYLADTDQARKKLVEREADK